MSRSIQASCFSLIPSFLLSVLLVLIRVALITVALMCRFPQIPLVFAFLLLPPALGGDEIVADTPALQGIYLASELEALATATNGDAVAISKSAYKDTRQ